MPYTHSPAYNEYYIHPVLYSLSTTYTKYCIHWILDPHSTGFTEFCIYWVQDHPKIDFLPLSAQLSSLSRPCCTQISIFPQLQIDQIVDIQCQSPLSGNPQCTDRPPQSAPPISFNHGVKVHHQICRITALECISKFSWPWPLRLYSNLFNYTPQACIILTSKGISKLDWSQCGEAEVLTWHPNGICEYELFWFDEHRNRVENMKGFLATRNSTIWIDLCRLHNGVCGITKIVWINNWSLGVGGNKSWEHLTASAKCNSVWKPYANLPDLLVAHTSPCRYFQMLPAPLGALQSALRLCKSILMCSWNQLLWWRCIQDATRFDY